MFWNRFVSALLCLAIASTAIAQDKPVTIQEDDQTYTLDNGIVTAKVSKQSGDIVSLVHKGIETLSGAPGGHPYGYWSHDARSSNQVRRITIDPKTNGGERGEVSIKGISSGAAMGRGPGGSFVSDIEIRYCMGRGESGVYTYSIFEHKPEYPNATLGEARFCAKLTEVFDWMLVNNDHNFHRSKMEGPGYNKYNYTTIQFEHPYFGWASTEKQIGFFFVNASIEYLTGPPTKVEFMCHAHNTILQYWRSSHYGGGSVDVAKGEHWTKVIGPFLLYVNSGGDPQKLWQDAKEQQAKEAAKWPYQWVADVDYPTNRATVKGQIVVNDPLVSNPKFSELRVGLAHPPYTVPTGRPAQQNTPSEITWMTDSKHYSFWTRGNDDGTFAIPAVRPGKYNLHAFADGLLGEYLKADITVEAGKDIDLGKLNWQIVRRGKPIWEIGVINRSAIEFVKGAEPFQNGMDQVYAQMFPNGVNYVVGKSDYTKDWFFKHVPLRSGPDASARQITFNMPQAPKGKATLRISFAGKQSEAVAVSVNGQEAGAAGDLWFDSSVGRNQNRGMWAEREVTFDASLLKAGENVIKLSLVGAGGVLYDYLRLELDETAIQTTLAN